MSKLFGFTIIIFGIIILILIGAALKYSGRNSDTNPASAKQEIKACPYQIIDKYDYSVAGQDRMRYSITSAAARTKAELAMTGIQAAKDLIGSNDEVLIWIDWNKTLTEYGGCQRAIIEYAPGGKNLSGRVWEIQVNSNEITPKQVEVATAWAEHREDFKTKDGVTDDSKLVPYLAKKLNLPENEITTIPLVIRESYPYSAE